MEFTHSFEEFNVFGHGVLFAHTLKFFPGVVLVLALEVECAWLTSVS